MAITFLVFHCLSKPFQHKAISFLLIPVWLGYEFLHLRWELSWPWLSLGNTFSLNTSWVQWYEYTGILGGSAWVLLCNTLIYEALVCYLKDKSFFPIKKATWKALLVVFIPITISYTILSTYAPENEDNINVLVVQPNIDPYNEKFSIHYTPVDQLKKFFQLIEPFKNQEIDLILGPETMLSSEIWEERIESFPVIQYFNEEKKKWPKTSFLVGASTSNFFETKVSSAAKELPNFGGYIESYNTSLFFSSDDRKELVHKSKLVLGVEKIPFSGWLPFLENFALENGGTSGSLGTEKTPKVLHAPKGVLAPVICYESIYGEFIGEQVNKGANLICVLTNDGWWGDSPGYQQHFSFSRLRAIENRRWVARSANTGTSGFIDPTGKVITSSNYWEPDVLKLQLNLNNKITFYTKYGDLLGRGSIVFTVIFILFFLYKKITSRKKNLTS